MTDTELDQVVDERQLIDGDALLREVHDWFATYISTTTAADHELLALFAAHTHLAAETYTTPRLQVDSPVPSSGKTTCLEHLQRLCHRSVLMASVASPALLTRMLDAELRTILIDEADRSLSPDKEGIADLFAVLNSGYKRGATRPVLVPTKGGGWGVSEMPTFSPVVIAGNNPNLPEDTRSRIIRVLLLPDLDGTVEETNWELIEENAIGLHDQLARWADQVREEVRIGRPTVPAGITGRFREKWAPLKRVAAAAGGDWAAAVDRMALNDKEEYELDKEDGLIREVPAAVLLKHIYELWQRPHRSEQKFMPTENLRAELVSDHPAVWGAEGPIGKDLTAKRLGSMLAKGYKIHSKRETRDGPRGYLRSDFERAWSRMGVSPRVSGPSGASGSSGADSGAAPDSPGAPDAPDSGEGQGDTPDWNALWDDEPQAAAAEPPVPQCRICDAALWAPDSKQRGTCHKCYRQSQVAAP